MTGRRQATQNAYPHIVTQASIALTSLATSAKLV
ncbi:MAG: hypothetical protein JWR01_1633 [Subtercola sp.]|nr:hypothetical protein [Subtercola sp.]